MLHRLFIQLALIFVFATTQIGVTTHEIGHVATPEKHSQQDQNTPTEPCGQCVGYTQVASGLQSQFFVLPTVVAHFQAVSPYFFSALTTHQALYAARAPPQTFSM